MSAYAALIEPFAEHPFMRRALVACAALALGGAPVGTLLVLRRMSLAGDAMAHALLPGAALGFVLAGYSVAAMAAGSVVAGLAVALLGGWASRRTAQREDTHFAAFYLIALAAGVTLLSVQAAPVDLMHVLFGSILAVDRAALLLVATVASVTLLVLAAIVRPLAFESFDAPFLQGAGGRGGAAHAAFLVLVVLNLAAGFVALGTLMSIGLMMLPALAARYWVDDLAALAALATLLALACVTGGLLLSYHLGLPCGPAVVLLAGAVYGVSMACGRHGSLLARGR